MALRSTASEAICGNLEIMENILGFLHEHGEANNNPMSPGDSSKKDLLAACLVSKSLLDLALTILWRNLDSLLPVLRLFPTFQKDEQSRKWSLTGIVSTNHLQRVLFYTRRIRSIRITSPPALTNTLTVLSGRMQPLQPFLSLTELKVEFHPVKTILDPVLFMMPLTLTTISITGISPASRVAVASLLQHLSSNNESLKHLSLTGSLDETFLSILLECTSLRSLALTSIRTVFSADYLRDLSKSLTSLETLSFKLLRYNPAFDPISTGASFPPAVFASLLELTVTGDLPSISGILSTLKAHQLREITLSFSGLIEIATPEAATFAACVAQVAKINGLEGEGNLRVVKISHTNRSTCIDMGAFDILYALRATIQVLHLQTSQLWIESGKDYTNPLQTTLRYPELVDLRLVFRPASRPPNSGYFTFASLEFLTFACPNLKTLHISFPQGKEDEEVKPKDPLNQLGFPIHGLQTLVLHHLPVDRWKFSVTLAVAVARYLNKVLPRLSSVEYCEEGLSEEVKEWWTGVQEIWKIYQGKEMLEAKR